MSDLPDGIRIIDLEMNSDSRGCLTELFREEWNIGTEVVQWSFIRSVANVLRGGYTSIRGIGIILP